MLNIDKSFKNLVNLEDFKENYDSNREFDLYRIVSTKISIEVSLNNELVIADVLKGDYTLKKIEPLLQLIDEKTQKIQENAYSLFSVSSLTLDLLLGKQNPKKTLKNDHWYDIYVINLHLGNYSVNLELTYLNEFIRLIAYLNDTIVLAQTSEFRPFLNPVTQKDIDLLKQKMGRKFGEKEMAALNALKKHINQDFYRLLIYTNLYRRYSHLRNVDVKRRLIWTFKRTSLIYQLIMGKTLREVIDEEDTFLRHEFKYIERNNAIEMNNRLLLTDLLEIEPGDDGFSSYFKSLEPIGKFFSTFYVKMRITCNMSLSLLDAVSPRKMVKQIEANISNLSINLLKPKGKLALDFEMAIELLDVKFKEETPNYEKELKLTQKNIESILHDPFMKKR